MKKYTKWKKKQGNTNSLVESLVKICLEVQLSSELDLA
jgi:hypothetical protein